MTADDAERARFVAALDRFRAMGGEAAQDALLTTVGRDTSDQALSAGAFDILIAFLDALQTALAAADIQPGTDLHELILREARVAFGARFNALLRARAPGGSA